MDLLWKQVKTFDKNTEAFFVMVRAGLFPKREVQEFNVQEFKEVNCGEVYRMAEEQSVIGLVAEGIDRFKFHVSGFKIPQEWALQFVGQTLQIEQRNRAMNAFVARLIEKLRENDIYAILVKGQGIAQCYERPLWRASGDVDLLLSDANYEKAKKVLLPLAIDAECEYKTLKHLGLTMKGDFEVELHGMQHSRLSRRIDRVIDEVQEDVFCKGKVRSVTFNANDNRSDDFKTTNAVQVFLPGPDEDVIFVFTHILKHFYIEGIGLRQICDWCRLLWTYKDSLNHGLLEERLQKAGLMSEWKAFAAFAVEYLGIPLEGMPLYGANDYHNPNLRRKAERIMAFVMESGNFGKNRELKRSKIFLIGKIMAAWQKMGDFARHAQVFPLDSVKFYFHYVLNGMAVAREINSKDF